MRVITPGDKRRQVASGVYTGREEVIREAKRRNSETITLSHWLAVGIYLLNQHTFVLPVSTSLFAEADSGDTALSFSGATFVSAEEGAIEKGTYRNRPFKTVIYETAMS